MSLTSTPFLLSISAIAVALLVTSAALAGRRALVRATAVAVGVVAVIALWMRLTNPFNSGFPTSFFVWGAAPVLAIVLAVWTWPRSSWWRRALRLGAVPVCVAFAAATINAHYAYIPTVAALRGQNARDQVSRQTVTSIAQRAATTATIPERGVVLSLDMPASVSGFHARGTFVYLPPAWFATPRPALPVIMLISGSPGTPADWTRSASADVLFDQFASSHHGVAPILVMPDANGGAFDDTECVDGPRGKAETYLVEDVRSYVVSQYGAADDPRSWVVGGLSEGGTCGVVLTLRHPDRFGSFVDFGGQVAPMVDGDVLRGLYGGDRQAMQDHLPTHLLDHQVFPGLAGWFEVGMGDRGAHQAARTLAPLVAADGGQACLVERGGTHNFTFWHDALKNALPWLVARVGLTSDDPAAACTAAGGHLAAPPTATTTAAAKP